MWKMDLVSLVEHFSMAFPELVNNLNTLAEPTGLTKSYSDLFLRPPLFPFAVLLYTSFSASLSP
jgi:hypothetical protein